MKKSWSMLMNVENKWEKSPISIFKFILLQFFYWVIYMWVLPKIIVDVLVSYGLTIESTVINAEFLNYLISVFIAILLMLPLLKKERHLDISKMAYTLILSLSIMFFSNVIFSILLTLFNGPEASVNQSGLDMIVNFDRNKFLMIVIVLAPIFEELVFRGGIFRSIRGRKGFWTAALVSSFLFGFMHVMSSILLKEYIDLIYLFLYGGLGIVLAWAYEYNHSIYASIILHMAYNLLASSAILFA